MFVIDFLRVFPGVDHVAQNLVHANTVFDLGKNKRSGSPHFQCVALHHAEIGPHRRSEIGLVDHQKIRLRDSGPAFSRDLVAPGHVDHVDGKICEFPTEMRGQIVTT